MNKLEYSIIAKKDINNIKEYIIQDNEKYALELVDKITTKIDALIDFPLMGRKYINDIIENENFRYLICEKYMIFYTYENDIIRIERIIHSARDYINDLDF